MLNDDERWDGLLRRDRALDGSFFFGVLTTGVYCRPSCPARRPLRSNVRFYATPRDAERDGLRPCLRCRPQVTSAATTDAKVLELCHYIEAHSDERLSLAVMVERAGLSRFHPQRSFKASVGVTPKAYLEACRVRKLKHSLRQAKDVTEAVYDAGFGSSSRVYERADTRLGMTPNQYRRGGRGFTITYAEVDSPAGRIMIGATDRGVCSVQFGDSTAQLLEALRREFPAAGLQPMRAPERPEFRAWIELIDAHFSGGRQRLDLPLDVHATAFQMRVWKYLRSIPRGELRSYREVAAGIGRPSAVRAVARACTSNALAVVIPCHRVIRGTGELGGYRWGLERKRALIEMERSATPAC
jgi:AraC family transcriptional regulator of adaptative response/methylated-DNA-[protein]-cysteine methyltransferase